MEPLRAVALRYRTWCLRAVALGLVYAGLSWVVQVVTAFGDETSSSVFWPAAGVTVAVLLRRPRAEWPVLLAGVWTAETALDLVNGFGVGVSVLWGLANTAEPLLAAHLLTRAGRGRPDLVGRDGFLRFVGIAVILGPAVGATIGAGSSVLLAGDVWWPRLPRWFVGDAIGVLTIAPALLVATEHRHRLTLGRVAVPAVVLVTAVLVALAPWSAGAQYGLPYLVVPALVVVAIQLGPREAALAVLLVAVAVEVTTAASLGPFAIRSGASGLVEAQMFLAMSAFSTWAVSALMADLLERERTAAELQMMSLSDELTGLSNRRHLLQQLHLAVARSRREGGSLALLFVDLDWFKTINDTYGHSFGDHVLRTIGLRLRAAVREVDTVARLGGDEFVVLTDATTSARDARHLAERLEQIVAEPIPGPVGDVTVLASIGVRFARGAEVAAVEDVEGLLAEADRAMYRRKRVR